MDAGDAALGLYQVVDPTWSFVVSCDWQCKPQDEQTTATEVQPTQAALQSQTLGENDAQIGLYQLVDPRWYFAVSCDWQCRPEDEQTSVTTMTAVQPKELDEKDAQIGDQLEQQQSAKRVSQPPARTKCNVPLAESDARIGLYQMVDHRWNYVVSCDWQCKPPRGRKSAGRPSALRPSAARPSAARESTARQREPSKVTGEPVRSAALSEADARLGLYQIVNPRWDYVVSCDWQCRPPGETADEMPETADEVPETGGVDEVPETGAVPLSESDARLGLYQMVNQRWNFWISCDWQCRPLGDSGDEVYETADVSERQEEFESEVAEGIYSTSSLSTCREDDGRVSLFTQTGDIMMTLVGDEGEMGLVMLDEEGSAADQRLSLDVTLEEQAAEERKRQLAQLVKELAEDVCNHCTNYTHSKQYNICKQCVSDLSEYQNW